MRYTIERFSRETGEWYWVAGFADHRDLMTFLHSYIGWRNCAVYDDGQCVGNGPLYSMTVPRSVFTSHVRDNVLVSLG